MSAEREQNSSGGSRASEADPDGAQMGLGHGGFELGEAGLELLFEDVKVRLGDMLGVGFGEHAHDFAGLLGG